MNTERALRELIGIVRGDTLTRYEMSHGSADEKILDKANAYADKALAELERLKAISTPKAENIPASAPVTRIRGISHETAFYLIDKALTDAISKGQNDDYGEVRRIVRSLARDTDFSSESNP